MARMRSVLFVPGNRPDMVAKSPTLGSDAVILDLEDAVAPPDKPVARRVIREALTRGAFACPALVRINPLDSEYAEEDLRVTVEAGPWGIVVPKVRSRDDVVRIDRWLCENEAPSSRARGGARIVPLIELARAVQRVFEIAEASPRVAGLSFGAEDYLTEMQVERSDTGFELDCPRARISLAARAAGIFSLDAVYPAVGKAEELRRDAMRARQLGFNGKLVIHPSQIAIVNEVFTPSPTMVERARRIVDAKDLPENRDKGVFLVDGRMVDAPVLKWAEDVLASVAEHPEP